MLVLRDDGDPGPPATITEDDSSNGDADGSPQPSTADRRPLTEREQALLQDPIQDRHWELPVSQAVAAVVVDPATQERGPMYGPYGDGESWSIDESCPWLLSFAAHSGGRNAVRLTPGEAAVLGSGLIGSAADDPRKVLVIAPPQPGDIVEATFDGGTPRDVRVDDRPVFLVNPEAWTDVSVRVSGREVPVTDALPAFGSLGGCFPPNLRYDVSAVSDEQRRAVEQLIEVAFDDQLPEDPSDEFDGDVDAIEPQWRVARELSLALAPSYRPEVDLVVVDENGDFWALYRIPRLGLPHVWAKVVDTGDGGLKVTIESVCELVRFAGQSCPETE